MRMLLIDILIEKLKLQGLYIYIYIYRERERERERERVWIQVTPGVTLKNATPLNIFLIACTF